MLSIFLITMVTFSYSLVTKRTRGWFWLKVWLDYYRLVGVGWMVEDGGGQRRKGGTAAS